VPEGEEGGKGARWVESGRRGVGEECRTSGVEDWLSRREKRSPSDWPRLAALDQS
jgi:hypothetical protein